jgi:hypothetical protein
VAGDAGGRAAAAPLARVQPLTAPTDRSSSVPQLEGRRVVTGGAQGIEAVDGGLTHVR